MRFPIPLLAFLCTFPAAWPQPTPLSLEEAISLALERRPAVAAAQASIREAGAEVKQARADYYPQFGSSGLAKAGLSGALNGLQPVGLPNSPFHRNFANALNIHHTGFDFGRTKHTVGAARQNLEELKAGLRTVEAAVTLEATRAFYALLRARRAHEVARQMVGSREVTVRQAKAFYEGEIRSKVDFDLARAGLSETQLVEIERSGDLRTAMAALGKAIGDTQRLTFEPVEPDLTPPELSPLSELVELAYQNRPELASLRARRDAAVELVGLARSRRKPMMSFFFSGGWARFAPLTASKLLAIGTGLKIPAYTFGKLEGLVEAAEARAGVLDYELEEATQQVTLEVRAAYDRLESALQAMPVRVAQAEYARDAVRLARARYREQLGTIVELSGAETQVAQAEAAEVTAIYDAKTAEAELRFAVGSLSRSLGRQEESTWRPQQTNGAVGTTQ